MTSAELLLQRSFVSPSHENWTPFVMVVFGDSDTPVNVVRAAEPLSRTKTVAFIARAAVGTEKFELRPISVAAVVDRVLPSHEAFVSEVVSGT